MVEIEHKLEEAVHFVLLNDARLTQCAQYLKERLSFLDFKLFDCHVRHVDYHDVVAQVSLIEIDFSLIKLCSC